MTVFVVAFGLLTGFSAVASEPVQLPPSPAPIFQKYDEIAMSLKAPLQTLFDKHGTFAEMKAFKVAGQLTVAGKTIPVEVSKRGQITLAACHFPKLMLHFKEADTKGTALNGLTKLDLNTHCGDVTAGAGFGSFYGPMKFNHRESLIYRWQQILGFPTLFSRPVNMTYADTSPNAKSPVQQAQAIALEDIASLAKRSHALEIKSKDAQLYVPTPPPGAMAKAAKPQTELFAFTVADLQPGGRLDLDGYQRLMIFEGFVGNSDIMPEMLHNIKVVQLSDGRWISIGQDFNFSAVIVTPSLASFQIPYQISSSLAPEFERAELQRYIDHKAELYASLEMIKTEDPEGYETLRGTLDKNFMTIDDFMKKLQ